jgi:ABC-type antimicrobial peptide transport system permease subunit
MKEKVLYSYSGKERERGWTPQMNSLIIISCVGSLILLIACFNFLNLSIALTIKRYREAGIKKIAGSKKLSIIMQFLLEAWILSFSSLLVAVFLVKLCLPGLNTIFNLHLQLLWSDYKIILLLFFITFLTGLISGLLPALYLASSNPLNVLKGNFVTGHSYSIFRQGLIIFQFTIPVILIIFMMTIKIQSNYMLRCDIGVDRDKLIVVNTSKMINSHSENIKSELLAIPGIDAVSFTNCVPTMGSGVSNNISYEGKDDSEKFHFWCIDTDFDYPKTVNIPMTEGRFFTSSFSSDSNNYVINNVAAGMLKTKNPLGSTLTVDDRKGTIIGIFEKFHTVDLAGPYVPTIIRLNPSGWQSVLIKFSSGSYSAMSEKISKVLNKYDPKGPFTIRLFRELPNYSESQIPVPSNLIGVGFILAILLACMGLFGLASFTAERRTKEIGIRKTNGATTSSIIWLLQTNYAKMLLIAVMIALPVAFQLGTIFLGRFAFHASMPLWPYIIGPAIAIVIALSTINSLAWNAARRNPVKALRYE